MNGQPLTTNSATINVLPFINDTIPVYFTVILSDNTLNQGTIINMQILYGRAEILTLPLIKILNGKAVAILVTATYNSLEYVDILYLKALYHPQNVNNFARLSQKIPLGIFTDINANTIIGNDIQARADMINDYHVVYLSVVQQVYSAAYSKELELEYNGTVGLLSNSANPDALFLLLARLANVRLINYDLELFISQYIYYRLGAPALGDGYAVYIDDNISNPSAYWNLGILGYTELDATPPQTILAPPNFAEVLQNLKWEVFNASGFTPEFKQEITNLIVRVSRADLGNPVTFDNAVSPVDTLEFDLIGPTYPFDPRLLYGRCIEYIGNNDYPLNIIGYKKIT